MGLPLLIKEGVEADDVIGTLAKQAQAAGLETLLSTGDKDFAQLVGDRITLVNTMTNQYLDRQGVITKYGVAPERIPEFLALVGDTSDNIPGVPGVGPKTAVKWLNQMGDLDSLIKNNHMIHNKAGDALRASIPMLPKILMLTNIKCDVELGLSLSDLKPKAPVREELEMWYERFGISSLLKKLREEDKTSNTSAASYYETILTEAAFEKWIEKLERAPLISFDTETTSLNYMDAEIVGLSFAVTPNEAAYLPLAHEYPGVPEQLSREKVLARLKPILEDKTRPKLGHHLKYDANLYFRKYGGPT